MSDLAGNDIGYAVRTSLGLTDAANRDPAVEYSADVADAVAKAGRFGQKAGKGWCRPACRPEGGLLDERLGTGTSTPSRACRRTIRMSMT